MYRLKWKKDNSKSKVRKIHWTYNKFPSISWTRVIVARVRVSVRACVCVCAFVCVMEVGGPVTDGRWENKNMSPSFCETFIYLIYYYFPH